MSNKGYIKLFRQIQDCWIWFDEEEPERFSRGQAWIDLLLLANHKEKKIRFGDGFRIIERGQFLTSKRKLAERWMWHRATVDRFLMLLEKDEMIATECTTRYTIITIVNYSIFQDNDAQSEPQSVPQSVPLTMPQSVPQYVPPSGTNNKCKNDKNEKNERNNKCVKHQHGEFKKVLLTDDEHQKLIDEFGSDRTERAIRFLDEYIAEKGYKSKSHYLAIRRWVFDAIDEKKAKKSGGMESSEDEFSKVAKYFMEG